MRKIKAHLLILGLSTVGLTLYIAGTLLYTHEHKFTQIEQNRPDQAPHASAPRSLAILADPAPSTEQTGMNSLLTGVNTVPSPEQTGVNTVPSPEQTGMNTVQRGEMAAQAASASHLDAAKSNGTLILIPAATPARVAAADSASVAASVLAVSSVSSAPSAIQGNQTVVLLPTATPDTQAPSIQAPSSEQTGVNTVQTGVNTVQTGVNTVQTGVVQEPAADVVIASDNLPTATPTLAAALALAASAPPVERLEVSLPAPENAPAPAMEAAVEAAPAVEPAASVAAAAPGAYGDGCQISSPPAALGMNPFYTKYCSALGLPILASGDVPDLALQRTWQTAMRMLDGIAQAEEIRHSMMGLATRIAIIGAHQVPTDMPEYHDLYTLFPNVDWNNRTRGIGATRQTPLLAIGEENLLCYANDQWIGQNLLVHELAHAIKNMGIDQVNLNLHIELERVYGQALERGLWAGTYAVSNVEEYWAEGVRIYFRISEEPNAPGGQRYPAGTRAEMAQYDPDLYHIIERIFGARDAIVRC